jgi:DNA-binding MarR family transcriptional regulator
MRRVGERDARAGEAQLRSQTWRELYELFLAEHERHLQATARLGVSPGDLKAIMRLDPGEPQPMGALAGTWRCDASTVTWIVDRLERRGLVERRPHERDRRVKVVALTPLGTRLRADVTEQFYEQPAGFSDVSLADLRAVRRVTARLRAPDA